jgi:hypothetical protein
MIEPNSALLVSSLLRSDSRDLRSIRGGWGTRVALVPNDMEQEFERFRVGIELRLGQARDELTDAELDEVRTAVTRWWREEKPIGESVLELDKMRGGEFARIFIGYLNDAREELRPDEAERLASCINKGLLR